MHLTLNKNLSSPTDIRQSNKAVQDRLRSKKYPVLVGYMSSSPEDGYINHLNYMEYLEYCWATHHGAVFTPDILWHIILCEFAQVVAKNKDWYAKFFTTTPDAQQCIRVATNDPVRLPIGAVIEELTKRLPTSPDKFLLEFSTQGEAEQMALYTAFADVVSPYYRYEMYMCGIPHIEFMGVYEDYRKIRESLFYLGSIIDPAHQSWITSVISILTDILNTFNDKDSLTEVLRQMFRMEKCGSGSQVEVYGWITQLFHAIPTIKFPCNFGSCASSVYYKNITTDKNFLLRYGLFSSKKEGDTLIPEFSGIIYLSP